MVRRTWLWVVLLVLVVPLVLAGCGRGPDESEPANTAPAAEAPAAEAPAAEAAGPFGDPEKGKEIFNTTCLACHGEGGVGVQGLGKDMTTSAFIAGKTDQELLDFIKVGRDTSSPDNTTGVAMPPKGGNPALTEEQLKDVISYVRTLNKP